jgi:hypothetical protein
MSLPVERFRETSYECVVRWCVTAACLLGLALGVSGCFHPDVKNGGFACSMSDVPPCPAGFSCVNGLCQDHPGTSAGADLATGTGGNGGGGGGGGGGSTVVDMAHVSDLAMSTPGDMASSACGMQGDDCSSQACCSGFLCFPGFDICL